MFQLCTPCRGDVCVTLLRHGCTSLALLSRLKLPQREADDLDVHRAVRFTAFRPVVASCADEVEGFFCCCCCLFLPAGVGSFCRSTALEPEPKG